MPEPSSAHHDELAAVARALDRAGLDLVRSFDAARYNQAIVEHPILRPLDLFGRPGALGLVIGNTRRLWPRFLEDCGTRPSLRSDPDPLDRFVAEAIAGALDALVVRHRVHLATAGGAARVSMLHAAEASGLAHVGPAHLAVHPLHGPWIGLRAVVVLDAAPPAAAPGWEPPPCLDCEAPCRTALDAAVERQGAVPTGQAEIASSWRDWVAVRDACPVGRGSRYGEAQLRYHYTKDRALLGRAARPGPGRG